MSQNVIEGDIEQPRASRFVWWSTNDSVREGIPSALAALEVVVAVAIYWATAIYFDTYAHLWVSICVAPLLLLRSEQSIALGVNWFRSYAPHFKESAGTPSAGFRSIKAWAAIFVTLIVSVSTSYLLARYWLIGHVDWAVFWRSAIVGILALQLGLGIAMALLGLELLTSPAVLIAIAGATLAGAGATAASGAEMAAVAGSGAAAIVGAGATAIAGARGAALAGFGAGAEAATRMAVTAVVVVLGPCFALGVWMRSLAVRLVATVRYLWIGFLNIPKNFIQNLFVVDFRQPAELLPGYRDREEFTSHGLIRAFQKEEGFIKKLFTAMVFPFFFLPAYAYRLSIKSTCWLYLPLVYIASERDFAFSPEHLLARLQHTPKEWLRRLLALTTLCGFIFTTLGASFLAKPSEPLAAKFVSPLEFLFLINIHSVKPWQIFNLLGALITLYLFLAAGDVRIDRAYAWDKQSQASLARKVQWLKILMRTRNVSSAILILILGIHALLLFSPLATYLPAFILSGLRWFYGEYMPGVP